MEDWFVNFQYDNIFNCLKSFCYGSIEFNAKFIVLFTLSTLAAFYGIFIRKLSVVKEGDYKIRAGVRVDAPYDGEESKTTLNVQVRI